MVIVFLLLFHVLSVLKTLTPFLNHFISQVTSFLCWVVDWDQTFWSIKFQIASSWFTQKWSKCLNKITPFLVKYDNVQYVNCRCPVTIWTVRKSPDNVERCRNLHLKAKPPLLLCSYALWIVCITWHQFHMSSEYLLFHLVRIGFWIK